jgi:hypothetical protein
MSRVADSRSSRFNPKDSVLDSHWLERYVGPRADLGSLKKKNTPYPCQASNKDTSVVHPQSGH